MVYRYIHVDLYNFPQEGFVTFKEIHENAPRWWAVCFSQESINTFVRWKLWGSLTLTYVFDRLVRDMSCLNCIFYMEKTIMLMPIPRISSSRCYRDHPQKLSRYIKKHMDWWNPQTPCPPFTKHLVGSSSYESSKSMMDEKHSACRALQGHHFSQQSYRYMMV